MPRTKLPEDIVDLIRDLFRNRLPRLESTVKSLQSSRGQIRSDGTIGHGDGTFQSVRNGVGDYSITFRSPFDEAPPVVQLTIGSEIGGALASRLHPSEAPTTNGFRVLTFNTTTGAATDSAFNFDAKHS
jgi:hypothetical protein